MIQCLFEEKLKSQAQIDFFSAQYVNTKYVWRCVSIIKPNRIRTDHKECLLGLRK